MSSKVGSPTAAQFVDAETNGFSLSEEKDLDQNLEHLKGTMKLKPGTAGKASSAASGRLRMNDVHSLGSPSQTPSQSLDGPSLSMGGSIVRENEDLGDEYEHYGNPPDNFEPTRKSVNFEFTSNYGMFRVLRLILYIQMIALIIDNENMNRMLNFIGSCV